MKNWKNNYYTVTETVHKCKYCNETIPEGSQVRTVNPRHEPRFWVCTECDTLLQQLFKAYESRENTAFGDDGGWMANDEYFKDLFGKFASRCEDKSVIEQLEKEFNL